MADKPDMVPARSWRDHFKVDDKILKAFWSEFQESSPLRASELNPQTAASSVEFVLWCVREGHFTELEFTRYQSEVFNLPVIRDDFFNSPIDHDFWARVKELHPWTASCVPLTEWDGYMLIGSVWPEETFKTSLRHRLVLATPSNLRAQFERFQTKTSTAPFTMPAATLTPPPAKKAEAAPAKKAEPKFDPADPFAALSRELGLVPDGESEDEHTTEGAGDEHAAPEGLVIPEGLSFNKDELARLGLDTSAPLVHDSIEATNSEDGSGAHDSFTGEEPAMDAAFDQVDPAATERLEISHAPSSTTAQPNFEPGTVVHDFETGEGEVVEKKTSQFAEQLQTSKSPSKPLTLDDLALELEALAQPAAPVHQDSPDIDLDATQPSIVKHGFPPPPEVSAPSASPAEPPALTLETEPVVDHPPAFEIAPPATTEKKTRPAPPPSLVIPFAPVVTPTQPAMVKPAAPEVAPPPPQAPDDGQPKRPVPEATIVVQADETIAVPEAPKAPRKPLFEPSSSGASEPTTGKIPPPVMRPASSITQTSTGVGSGTGTRGRRLEATPVTSFFGMGGAAGPSLSKSRNSNDHSGRAVAISKLQPIHLDQCSSVDEAGAQALLQACNIFETAMILLFKDGELQPWKWNDLFLSVKGERPDAIELQDPSIFKVVFRTAKPYHGYVVTSTVNQKFLNEFYRGMLPKHATLIPIMIDGRMGGMLLCFTNSKIDYRQSLRLMERLAYDLARVFKSLRSSAKAS